MGNINELFNLLTVLVDEEQRAKLEEILSGKISFASSREAHEKTCIAYKINPSINPEQKEQIEEKLYEMGIKKWEFSGN